MPDDAPLPRGRSLVPGNCAADNPSAANAMLLTSLHATSFPSKDPEKTLSTIVQQGYPGFFTEPLHAACDGKAYGLTYEPVPAYGTVRFNKDVLEKRILKESDIQCSWVALDFDRRDERGEKLKWESPADFSGYSAVDHKPSYAHSTTHGWHLWFQLSRPVSPSELEIVGEQLRSLYPGADERCKDWTRIMGLPQRDSLHFAEMFFTDESGGLSKLDVDDLLPDHMPSEASTALSLTSSSSYVEAAYEGGVIPNLSGDGKSLLSALDLYRTDPPWVEFAESLYHATPLKEGGRDDTFTKGMGWLAGITRRAWANKLGHWSEERVASTALGLVEAVALATDHDSGADDRTGDSWFVRALDTFETYWARDGERVESRRGELQAKQVGMDDLPPILAIGGDARRLATLTPSGTYRPLVTALPIAIGNLQRDQMDINFELQYVDEKGATKDVPDKIIQRELVHPVQIVGAGVRLPGEEGTNYRLLTPTTAERMEVEYKHVEPEYHEWVDGFLRQLTLNPDELMTWLAHYPSFVQYKLPMLCLWGASRAGKSLVLQALTRFCTAKVLKPTDQNTRFTSYGSTLLIAYDEVYPVDSMKATTVRRSGQSVLNLALHQPIAEEQKRENEYEVQLPWRMCHVKNDNGFAQNMANAHASPDMAETWKAIALRLLPLQVNPGSREYTRRATEHKVDAVGDIAQHIAWMNQQSSMVYGKAVHDIEPNGFVVFEQATRGHNILPTSGAVSSAQEVLETVFKARQKNPGSDIAKAVDLVVSTDGTQVGFRINKTLLTRAVFKWSPTGSTVDPFDMCVQAAEDYSGVPRSRRPQVLPIEMGQSVADVLGQKRDAKQAQKRRLTYMATIETLDTLYAASDEGSHQHAFAAIDELRKIQEQLTPPAPQEPS